MVEPCGLADVGSLDEQTVEQEGPITVIDPEKVSKEPSALVEGFHWVTMDLADDHEVEYPWPARATGAC